MSNQRTEKDKMQNQQKKPQHDTLNQPGKSQDIGGLKDKSKIKEKDKF